MDDKERAIVVWEGDALMDGVRPRIDEVVVVEGIHDKQRVQEAVDADIIVLGGDRIGHRTMELLRRAVSSRGVIVFTDPDGAGERIRRRIDQAVSGCKHAYLRKGQAIGNGALGVEHASIDSVRDALTGVRQRVPEARNPDTEPEFTDADLYAYRLIGHPDAANRRAQMGDALGIGYGNAKAFLKKLNALRVTREEFVEAAERLR